MLYVEQYSAMFHKNVNQISSSLNIQKKCYGYFSKSTKLLCFSSKIFLLRVLKFHRIQICCLHFGVNLMSLQHLYFIRKLQGAKVKIDALVIAGKAHICPNLHSLIAGDTKLTMQENMCLIIIQCVAVILQFSLN